MPRLPHQRLAATSRHVVVERAARLHVGDDGRALTGLQQVLCVNHQELIAPDDPPFAIDSADPVTIAVESNSEVEGSCRDEILQIGKIVFDGGVRVMVGKSAVDLGEEDVMFTRQSGNQFLERRAGSAVAGVPADAHAFERRCIDAIQRCEKARDILVKDIALLCIACSIAPLARSRPPTQFLDVAAEERAALEYHLEAVVIGGVMAAGYLNTAVDVLVAGFGII